MWVQVASATFDYQSRLRKHIVGWPMCDQPQMSKCPCPSLLGTLGEHKPLIATDYSPKTPQATAIHAKDMSRDSSRDGDISGLKRCSADHAVKDGRFVSELKGCPILTF